MDLEMGLLRWSNRQIVHDGIMQSNAIVLLIMRSPVSLAWSSRTRYRTSKVPLTAGSFIHSSATACLPPCTTA